MKLTLLERFETSGHKNILGTHKSTIEFTKEGHLTKKGDCIIGVSSQIGCINLKQETKRELRKKQKIYLTLKSANLEDNFTGFGHPDLQLTDENDIVFRKSEFICGRTILISCSKASKDINRNLINNLKNPDSKITVEIYSILED